MQANKQGSDPRQPQPGLGRAAYSAEPPQEVQRNFQVEHSCHLGEPQTAGTVAWSACCRLQGRTSGSAVGHS